MWYVVPKVKIDEEETLGKELLILKALGKFFFFSIQSQSRFFRLTIFGHSF